MSKERDIEILENKIVELDKKILAFEKYNISDLKKNKLIQKKEKYESQLLDLK